MKNLCAALILLACAIALAACADGKHSDTDSSPFAGWYGGFTGGTRQ